MGTGTYHLGSFSLFAVVLDKEPLVRLLWVVGGEVGGNQQEFGVEGQFHHQPVAAAAATAATTGGAGHKGE